MRIWSVAIVFLFACGPDEPANAPTAQTVTVPSTPASTPAPIASAAPVVSATATATAPEPAPAKADAKFKVSGAMKTDGQVDDKILVTEANGQIDEVSKCAAIVRKTDHMTGSMNLQVKIAKDGTTKGELQSPATDDAKKCILDAVGKWKLPKSGAGTAMVLLNIVE